MADSASTSNQTISDAIDALRGLRISVDLTDEPVTFGETRADGCALGTVGLITITANGRAFVELYDCGNHVRLTMLENVARSVEDALQAGRKVVGLRCWMHPETVLELREWAELRDELLVVA